MAAGSGHTVVNFVHASTIMEKLCWCDVMAARSSEVRHGFRCKTVLPVHKASTEDGELSAATMQGRAQNRLASILRNVVTFVSFSVADRRAW